MAINKSLTPVSRELVSTLMKASGRLESKNYRPSVWNDVNQALRIPTLDDNIYLAPGVIEAIFVAFNGSVIELSLYEQQAFQQLRDVIIN